MPNPLPREDMDDLTARVGRLEVIAADTRADVAFVKATLPHLATQAELEELRAELRGDSGTLRTEFANTRAELKADIAELRAELKSDIGRLDARIERVDGNIARMEASMVRWFVGLTVACGGVAGSLAFTAAKLIH